MFEKRIDGRGEIEVKFYSILLWSLNFYFYFVICNIFWQMRTDENFFILLFSWNNKIQNSYIK